MQVEAETEAKKKLQDLIVHLNGTPRPGARGYAYGQELSEPSWRSVRVVRVANSTVAFGSSGGLMKTAEMSLQNTCG